MVLFSKMSYALKKWEALTVNFHFANIEELESISLM